MRHADKVFVALTGLALASSAILVALLLSFLPHVPRLVRGDGDLVGDAVHALILLLASVGIGLGMASLARQLWSTLQLLRGLLRQRLPATPALARAAAELGIGSRVDLVADDRPFSFTYWFLRPRVCVSTGLVRRLAADELRAVLSHERYHLRHRDPLRLVVARYFAAGLYVVPLVDDLVAHYAVLKEIAADEDAVRACGVRSLARALYKLMPHADEMDMGLLAPVGGLSVTEARIEQLVEPRPIALPLPLPHVALSVATLTGAMLLVLAQVSISASVPLAWPPAAVILLAAIPGGTQQLRAVLPERR